MRYRKLGNSDLNVSVLCLGGNIFGHFCNEEETKKIIDFAIEYGINFIDTANVYGDGLSETYIGKALKGRRNRFIIATKAGLRSDQKPENIFTKEYISKSIEESLQRLQTDYIDLYQIHHFDTTVPVEETIKVLNELIESGKVRYIGCSNYSLKQLQRSINLKFKHKFISSQIPYNLLDQSTELEIAFCKENDIGVLAYQSLARGLLTGKYDNVDKFPDGSRALVSDSIRKQITPEKITLVNKLKAFANEQGHSVTALALSWILRNGEISSAIIGVRSIQQLKDCIAAIDWNLSTREIEVVEKIING